MKKLEITWPVAGRYILAVSGGADSMALLDLMADAADNRGYDLVVAHFDHGLRTDSAADRKLVQEAASRYGLAFDYHEAGLGRASEAAARSSRYRWLKQVRASRAAVAIVTGHHADDLLETSLLNLARGTGRRGLAPMQTGPVLRPLLAVTRAELRDYAANRELTWREDSTNADLANPRNFLRRLLLPQADATWRERYHGELRALAGHNAEIDQALNSILEAHRETKSAYLFPKPFIRDLSLAELEELLVAASLALDPHAELERRVVREVALFAKTARSHRHRPLCGQIKVAVFTGFVRVSVE